ncbi:MAG: hypothetical protein ABI200_07230 [Gaiellales bacterium]
MKIDHQLIIVAFVRTTGGRIRVLLGVDRAGTQLFGGEPVLLVEHRPGQPSSELEIEGSDQLDASLVKHIGTMTAVAIVEAIEAAFDDSGNFVSERLLGCSLSYLASPDAFGK